MNRDAKFLNKILANPNQEYVQKIIGFMPKDYRFYANEAGMFHHTQINKHNSLYKQTER